MKKGTAMSIFVKKIRCPKCKSTDYEKVDISSNSKGPEGVVLNAFDVGGRTRMSGTSTMVKGNMTEYFKCNNCGMIYPIAREK